VSGQEGAKLNYLLKLIRCNISRIEVPSQVLSGVGARADTFHPPLHSAGRLPAGGFGQLSGGGDRELADPDSFTDLSDFDACSEHDKTLLSGPSNTSSNSASSKGATHVNARDTLPIRCLSTASAARMQHYCLPLDLPRELPRAAVGPAACAATAGGDAAAGAVGI
jgi:hypothetical protein